MFTLLEFIFLLYCGCTESSESCSEASLCRPNDKSNVLKSSSLESNVLSCIRIRTGTKQHSGGALTVRLGTPQPRDNASETMITGTFVDGESVLEACYIDVFEVVLQNPTLDTWTGSVEFSSNGGRDWNFAECPSCRSALYNNTRSVDVEGNYETSHQHAGTHLYRIAKAAKESNDGVGKSVAIGWRLDIVPVMIDKFTAPNFWLLATYPFTGSTWIRNVWDVSTGIVSEAVFQEGGSDKKRIGIETWGGECGSRNYHGIVPNLGASDPELCAMVRRAASASESVLVKSHYPALKCCGDWDRSQFVRGVILTKRSPEKWCDSHSEGAIGFSAKQFRKSDDCAADVRAGMAHMREYYVSKSIPILELDFDAMASSKIGDTAAAVRAEFERLWAFTGVTPIRDGLRWFPPKRLQSS